MTNINKLTADGKKMGRPKIAEDGRRISVSLPTAMADMIKKRAQQEGKSEAEIARRLMFAGVGLSQAKASSIDGGSV